MCLHYVVLVGWLDYDGTVELAFSPEIINIGMYALTASLHTKLGIAQGPQITLPTGHHMVRHSSWQALPIVRL